MCIWYFHFFIGDHPLKGLSNLTQSRATQPAPQPQSAPTRAGDGGGATVTINVGTLTSLVGHGGSFSLDDLVGAGGVELPRAPAAVANPQVLRGKGRPKVVRYKSSRELKKRKRNAS